MFLHGSFLKFIIIYIQKKKIQVDDLDEGYNGELKRMFIQLF